MFLLNSNPMAYLAYVDDFLSHEEIENLIAKGEQSGYEQAGVRQPDGSYQMHKDYRDNLRGSIEDTEFSNEMFTRASNYIPKEVNAHSLTRFHPVWKFYKYGKGHFFNWHKDGSLREGVEKSLVTFMIYLSSVGQTDFEGHEPIEGKAGRLVIFNHKIKHRSPALEVDTHKIVIRTDVMYIPFYELFN